MSRTYKTITADIAKELQRLHDEYPELGHHGLGRVLEEAGIEVDEHELRMFCDDHKYEPGSTSVHMNDTSPLRWLGVKRPGEE